MEPCGSPVPKGSLECGENGTCRQAVNHPGPHSGSVSRCNRPSGHPGNHMVLTLDASRLEEWERV
jgi:hypothetical protein